MEKIRQSEKFRKQFLSNKPITPISHSFQQRKPINSLDQSIYNFNNSFDTILNSMDKSIKKLKKQYKNIPIPIQESYHYQSHVPEDFIDYFKSDISNLKAMESGEVFFDDDTIIITIQ